MRGALAKTTKPHSVQSVPSIPVFSKALRSQRGHFSSSCSANQSRIRTCFAATALTLFLFAVGLHRPFGP